MEGAIGCAGRAQCCTGWVGGITGSIPGGGWEAHGLPSVIINYIMCCIIFFYQLIAKLMKWY